MYSITRDIEVGAAVEILLGNKKMPLRWDRKIFLKIIKGSKEKMTSLEKNILLKVLLHFEFKFYKEVFEEIESI